MRALVTGSSDSPTLRLPLVQNATPQERLDAANQLLRFIGNRGRRFFWSNRKQEYCRLERDHRGRIWFIDIFSGERVFTHYSGEWRGFSNGGTLRDLVIALREFILCGTLVPAGHFGPWSEVYCGGDLWGYGFEPMQEIRDEAARLGVIRTVAPASGPQKRAPLLFSLADVRDAVANGIEEYVEGRLPRPDGSYLSHTEAQALAVDAITHAITQQIAARCAPMQATFAPDNDAPGKDSDDADDSPV